MLSPNRGWRLETIEFNPGALEGLHRALTAVAEHGDDSIVVLAHVGSGLEGRGASIRRAKSDALTTSTAVTRTVQLTRRVARVVREYGEAVAVHARNANELVDDITAAHAAVEEAAAAYAGARDAEWWQPESDPLETARRQARIESAHDTLVGARRVLADLWERWEALYARWDDAYDAAVARLARSGAGFVDAATVEAIDLLASADTPAEVALAWASLTPGQRARLHDGHPEFIGNLEGVPYRDRFIANRTSFDRARRCGPHGDPLDSQLATMALEMNRFAGALLVFQPFEHPQATAAVMYGVSIADDAGHPVDPMAGITNVNVMVGGMFWSLGDLKAWGRSARNLNRYANAYGALAGRGTASATIAWYGYDSPNMATEHTMESATEGAARLTQTLRGLQTQVNPGTITSVIGHSYGSTTAFLAVGGASDTLGVDRLIAVGSAGVPDEYHAGWTSDAPMDYSGTQIFASRAPGDWVARYGEASSFGHGTDPESLPGAVSFESDGGRVPALGGGTEEALGTPGHASHDGGNTVFGWWEKDNGYLSRDAESFRNVANIVANGEPFE